MTKVLVLGGSGLIGNAIINEMSRDNEFDLYATYFKNRISLNKVHNFKLDIGDLDNIKKMLNMVKPRIVISCLRGDFKKQLSLHVEVAEFLRRHGGMLYFFSTTNVFDNDLSRAHFEDDAPDSQTDYGKYKIECENRIRKILCQNACILRIPQIWGRTSPRMKELIDSIENGKKITVYPGLFINTNTETMVAKQLCYIIKNRLHGIFHLVAEDVIGYKKFYLQLVNGLGADNAVFQEDFSEKGNFALLSKRIGEFPEKLRITNQMVMDYLVNQSS